MQRMFDLPWIVGRVGISYLWISYQYSITTMIKEQLCLAIITINFVFVHSPNAACPPTFAAMGD